MNGLHTLFVQKNLLSALPASLSKLEHLTWLNMSYNKFTNVPDQVFAIFPLFFFFFSEKMIIFFIIIVFLTISPSQLSRFPKLMSLDLTHNKIAALPMWLKTNQKNIQINIDSFTKKGMGGDGEEDKMDISIPRQFRQKIHITNELEWDMEDPKSAFVFERKLGQV